MKQLRLHSLIIFAPQRIRREAYVWIRLSHNHILPFLGITMRADFGVVPALVSPWMENKSLSDYLELEFPQLSDHRKSELVGVRLLRRFILTSDFRYSRWPPVFFIVRPICSDDTILKIIA
jgi:serine/threonine protein kinase